eukprot:scaffold7856_cov72-Skeletonema_dohrnii-CCMP3373.AAC.4
MMTNSNENTAPLETCNVTSEFKVSEPEAAAPVPVPVLGVPSRAQSDLSGVRSRPSVISCYSFPASVSEPLSSDSDRLHA